jgi:hypothetical protein
LVPDQVATKVPDSSLLTFGEKWFQNAHFLICIFFIRIRPPIMYLINCDGSYRLEFHHSSAGVSYLILSHTWGNDRDEVSYKDMGDLTMAKKKKGFRKIEQICAGARHHGIPYAWVDTCCIDKSSSAELSESINSMYHWYRSAVVCVAYLEDLKAGHGDAPEDQLRLCRWFTRGWTLQELIAPKLVLFVDETWKERGTKHSLGPVLSRITGISAAVLDGTRGLHQIAVAQRMSWAARRQTTRAEDIAYCLLGIFDINMPLLYGEGEKAFVRLQQAVLQQTGDLSAFAWSHGPTDRDILLGVQHSGLDPLGAIPFAVHPACFWNCEMVERFADNVLPSPSITITSAGVRLFGCIITTGSEGDGGYDRQLLHLQCKIVLDPAKQHACETLAMPLWHLPDGYARRTESLHSVSPSLLLGLGGSEYRHVLTEICLISGMHMRSFVLGGQEGKPGICAVRWDLDWHFPDVTTSYYPQHLWEPASRSFHVGGSNVFLGAVEVEVAGNDPSRNIAEGSARGPKLWVLCGTARTAAAGTSNDHRDGHGRRVNSDDRTGWEPWAAILKERLDGTLPDLVPGFQAARLRNPYTLADVSLALRTELRGAYTRLSPTCTVPYGAGVSITFRAKATVDNDGRKEVLISATL